MNEYIFFSTEGKTYPPKGDKDIENCQLLGVATGHTPNDAKNNLLKQNPWIVERGFNTYKIICEQLMTSKKDEIEYYKNQLKYLKSILNKSQLEAYECWLHHK